MDLLPELRNRVYRLCLVIGDTISPSNSGDRAEDRAFLPLLQLDRQTRNEARGIYPAENQFRFHWRGDDGDGRLSVWLISIEETVPA